MKSEKSCRKCGTVKPLHEFYMHAEMKDSHVHTCKTCYLKANRAYYKKRIEEEPGFREKRRKICRDSYFRTSKWRRPKVSAQTQRKTALAARTRYPEKYIATCQCSKLRVPEGKQKHHWSYQEPHRKDVIFLDPMQHNKYHRYMTYDQERMMYRTPDGVLLDTREAAEAYYATLEDKD